MSGILIYSEDGTIARQMIAAGSQLRELVNEPIVVITTEADTEQFIAAGADKVIVLKGDNSWPESYAGNIAEIVGSEQASVVLFGGTARGKDIAAKVAAQLKAGLVTDAQTIDFVDDHVETTRMIYGGLAVCRERVVFPAMVTIPSRTFDEPPQEKRQGKVVFADVAPDSRVQVNNVCPIQRQGADITEAKAIVCVGRGVEKKEDLQLAENLVNALGAEIACTRGIAEDYHWLPIEKYIGISGQKVKPEIYIGLGVSGQVQHITGMRDSKVIVAVNNNEKAPIFEAADYGVVGDLYEVVPLLVEALKKRA